MSENKKRKGLSAADKRKIILGIYHSRQEVFNLKEIEAIASKQGVVQQTVKEHNQGLIDDFLVQSDKIGSSNFFWSFPSKAYQDCLTRKDTLKNNILKYETKIFELEKELLIARESRKRNDRQSKVQTTLISYTVLLVKFNSCA